MQANIAIAPDRTFASRSSRRLTVALRAIALVASPMALAQANVVWGQQVAAETTPAPADDQIQDIVVTAQKRSENINNVGISITAVTGDALVSQGVLSPADLVRVVPGLSYARSTYGVPVYTIRGIGFYDTSLAGSPAVSVYVDEIPLPYSAMTTGAGLDVERVEILKGPQGTLFGQNSTGGAINYISAKPTPEFAAGLDATYQSFGEAIVQGYVSGPLSDTLGVRVAARVNKGGDWQRSHTRNDKIGGSDQLIGRVLVNWQPTDRFSAELNLNGWRDRSDNQQGQFGGFTSALTVVPAVVRAAPTPPRSNRFADWDPGKEFARDDKFYQIAARAQYELNDTVDITSLTSYTKLTRYSVNDTDATALPAQTVIQLGHTRSFYQELRANAELGPRVKLLLGGNYGHDKTYESLANITPAGFSSNAFTSAEGVGTTKVSRFAIFGSLDFELLDRVTFQGSARYSESCRDYVGCSRGYNGDNSLGILVATAGNRLRGTPVAIAPGTCATLGPAPTFTPGPYVDSLSEDNISWRANLNWQATSTALFYANVSRGYKEGGFPLSGASFSFSLGPVVQEKVMAYEAGFKLGLADRHVQLNGAVFYYDYSDKQIRGRVTDPVIGRQNRLLNIPKSRVQGAEINATILPFQGLKLDLGATYVDTKIQGTYLGASDAVGNAINVDGQKFPLTPDWQVQADVEYRFPVSTSVELFVGAHYNYQGGTNSGLGDLPVLAVPSYQLVDLRAGAELMDGRLSLTAFARNLTKEYYWTFVSFAAPNTAARYTGRPRTFGATLSYRY